MATSQTGSTADVDARLQIYNVLFFDLQKQPDLHDCDLFAIANAMAICDGQSPEDLNYSTKVMRKHLAGCLVDKVFRHFPATKRSVKQETKRSRFTVPAVCLKVEGE